MIEWTNRAVKDLRRADKTDRQAIIGALEHLVSQGFGDVRKLQGIHPPEWRLRVGNWRVRFERTEKEFVCFKYFKEKMLTINKPIFNKGLNAPCYFSST